MVRNSDRIPALDGLRGVAVLLVLVSHLDEQRHLILPGGGLVGVQLFFALSGFLITGILLGEIERTGGPGLGAFWMRRVRRLFPALLVITAACPIAAMALGMDVRESIYDTFVALTYTTNVLAHFGGLRFTWTLAVEEQFYLAWPLLVLGAYRVAGRTGAGVCALSLAAVTAVARFTVPMESETMNHLMRWDALLYGCAIAALRPRPSGWMLVLAAATLAYCTLAVVPYSATTFAATAICSGLVVLCAERAPVLRAEGFRYLGRRSYGLYLWSCFLMRFELPWWATVVFSIGAAEASWRLVERRWRLRPDLPDLDLAASCEGVRRCA